jgi:hypothetical protein
MLSAPRRLRFALRFAQSGRFVEGDERVGCPDLVGGWGGFGAHVSQRAEPRSRSIAWSSRAIRSAQPRTSGDAFVASGASRRGVSPARKEQSSSAVAAACERCCLAPEGAHVVDSGPRDRNRGKASARPGAGDDSSWAIPAANAIQESACSTCRSWGSQLMVAVLASGPIRSKRLTREGFRSLFPATRPFANRRRIGRWSRRAADDAALTDTAGL